MSDTIHNEGIIIQGGNFNARQVSVGRNSRATQDDGEAMAEQLPSPEHVGIAPNLYHQLESTLLKCGPFDDEKALRAVFIDSRISLWRDRLPRANSTIEQVRGTIDYLYRQCNDAQENALVLLLRVLVDQLSPGDACRKNLARLADLIAD